MKTADFDYDLPDELIAQTPAQPRDAARLLIMDRRIGTLSHGIFRDIEHILEPGDLLVLNRTRVLRARLRARKIPTGGRVELLLLRRITGRAWEVLVGGRKIQVGVQLDVENRLRAEVVAHLDGPRRVVQFSRPIDDELEQVGRVPLPPYIRSEPSDPERYQTVFAKVPGSAAAPTAGLHFTPELIERLLAKGINTTKLTLHIGLDTFAPVTVEDPQHHRIHTEWCSISAEAVAAVRRARSAGGRVIAVGTTCVRALETGSQYADEGETLSPFEGPTDLFILPGFQFRVVEGLLTNFHLPRSTLLMLTCAFAGRAQTLAAYEVAKRKGYRFYSFGDAMLIL